MSSNSRLLRREAQQGQDRFEQAQLGLRRITRLARFGFRLQLRKEVGELSPKRTEPFAYLVEVDRGQGVAARLAKRYVGQRQVRLRTATRQEGEADRTGP